ncbi:MAG: CRISPR-associated helicase Cas3' [Campylobacterales bacterium]|nr:CRISPR-associated helicase Cas3' [Campylobacterales bacterium]
MNYLSHPDKLLTSHIENIVAFDRDDKLFALIAKFHDLGKTTHSFQQYIQKITTSSEPHAFVSALLFLLQFSKKLDVKSILFAINAISSHHGKLKSLQKLFDDMMRYSVAQSQANEIAQKNDAVVYFGLKEFDFSIVDDFEFDHNDPTNPLKFSLEEYVRQKELFSKLIFADKFEAIFSSSPLKSNKEYPLENLYIFRDQLSKNEKRDFAREQVFCNFEYHPYQNIYLLTAPTGIGKTLLSLELALKIKEQRELERVIYTIPFTSIIDQTVEIFESIYGKTITKHHHKVEYNALDEELNNDYDRMKFLTESWSESFIVSTFYQLFFALFSNINTDNIKFQSLRNSVVVMDEVQAIPHQLWSVMQNLFEILSTQLNTVFILMSATMPIITKNGYQLADKEVLFGLQNRYRLGYLELVYENEDSKVESLKESIKGEYQKGKSVLCVVNTIKNSKKLFKALNDELGYNVYCLNSYMLGCDREATIKALKELDSNLVKNKILISTQVIEAGVDLDFDIGFRELSPLSSIIQTAGRVNREGRKTQAQVLVFDTLGFQIYDTSLMNETKKHLVKTLQNQVIEEQSILSYIESYFRAVGECLGDSKDIAKAIEAFDFEKINKAINEIFQTENDRVVSVAIGVDLSHYEKEYDEYSQAMSKWELKSYKERTFKEIGKYIINIKKRDLEKLYFNVDKSDIFGIAYISNVEDFYSVQSGFLIEEEKEQLFMS